MRTETVEINFKKVTIYYFDNPMFHSDWHEAEEKGLVYIKYSHQGPDYWDDFLIFAKTEDETIVVEYFRRAW